MRPASQNGGGQNQDRGEPEPSVVKRDRGFSRVLVGGDRGACGGFPPAKARVAHVSGGAVLLLTRRASEDIDTNPTVSEGADTTRRAVS